MPFDDSSSAPISELSTAADEPLAQEHPTAADRAGPRDRSSSVTEPLERRVGRSGEGVRFLPGTMLDGRFRIVSVIGRGGMGEVYRADDLMLGQPVALKFLPESVKAGSRRYKLLLDEVKTARQISHQNVCRVHDLGEIDGIAYLSMEYIDGEDLASLLRRIGRLPQDKAIEIAQQIARGLAAAHKQGILHQDLKPANLMIDGKGRAKISDFGLAVLTTIAQRDGRARGGTPAYMAPELFDGKPPSVQSDLYALGLVLYELFTGRRPFKGETMADLAYQHRHAEPIAPSVAVEDLALEVEDAILECLAKDPLERPTAATEVAVAFYGHEVVPSWRPTVGDYLPLRPHWVMAEKLGEGGFGEVWLATHSKTGDQRVFKFCYDARNLRALKREITLFRLMREELGDRDDITRIIDWNFAEPPFFIESEYTRGGNLVAWAAREGGTIDLPLKTRLELVAQVATALAAAHSMGIIHKDVKPTNILINDRGEQPSAQLSDFGIGGILEKQRLSDIGITAMGMTAIEETSSSSAAGTRLYMAPEQVEGRIATLEADVYALGVLLYQIVVGDFSRSLAPGWRRDVDDTILREDIAAAVDRAPERRPKAAQMALSLRTLEERRKKREAAEHERQLAHETQEALQRSRQRRQILLAATAALTLFAAALVWQNRQVDSERARAEQAARHASDIARVAVARNMLAGDPTTAALVMAEVDRPSATPYGLSTARQILSQPLATAIQKHDYWLVQNSWSPTGQWLAVLTFKTVEIWREDLRMPLINGALEGMPTKAAWSPDGRRLAVSSDSGSIRIWDVDRLEQGPQKMPQGQAPILSLDWDPTGEFLAAGNADGTVHIFEGTRLATQLAGHRGPVQNVAWSPVNPWLLTTAADGTARLWERNGRSLSVLEGAPGPTQAAWHPDGRLLATGSADGTVRLLQSSATGQFTKVRELATGGQVRELAWSTDGRLAIGVINGTLLIWSPGDPQPQRHEAHQGAVDFLAWARDGQYLASGSQDGLVRVWGARRLGLRGHAGPISSISWHPQRPLLATGAMDKEIRLWDLESETLSASLTENDSWFHSVAWSPDGDRVLATSIDGTLRLWQLDNSKPPVIARGHSGGVLGTTWSPDGRQLATASQDGTVRVWAMQDEAPKSTFIFRGHQASPLSVAWSPDGQKVLSSSMDGTAQIWHPNGEGATVVLQGHQAIVYGVAWSPDSRQVATASFDGTARLWSLEGQQEAIFLDHEGSLGMLAWSPDGTTIAVSMINDENVRLVPVQDSGSARTVDGAALALDWSPNSQYLALGSWEGTVRVHPMAGGEPIVIEGHQGPVSGLAWSPDSQRLVTASRDGSVRISQLDAGDLTARISNVTSACLQVDFRVRRLGESPSEATERYATCERRHGRAVDFHR